MKTTNGKYLLSMQIELSPEEIAAILETQVDIIDEDIGSHEIIAHLRDFVNENIAFMVQRSMKLLNTEDNETIKLITPLMKERKTKR
jgi:hypothetical protein